MKENRLNLGACRLNKLLKRRDNVIVTLQDQVRKITVELERVKGSERQALTVGSLITTPLISHSRLLMKTMKSKGLEGEVHLEKI